MKTILLLLILCITISSNAQDYEIFKKKGKFGIKDYSGKEVFPPDYDKIYMLRPLVFDRTVYAGIKLDRS